MKSLDKVLDMGTLHNNERNRRMFKIQFKPTKRNLYLPAE